MPSLILVKPAAVPVGEFDLSGGPQVIGRLASAGCHIVLNAKPVSKVHATVTAEGGRFFITDEESHNGTLLNGVRLPPHVKTPLAPGDKIVICEFHLVFHEGDDIPTAPVAHARHTSATPEERLGALLALRADPDLTGRLRPVHGVVAEALFSGAVPSLDRVADALLGVFPQADRCLVLVPDEYGWPVPTVTRTRAPEPVDPRFCRALVVRALESLQAYVTDTVSGPAWPDVRSVLCVPLSAADGRPLGAILLHARDRARAFTATDLELACAVANLAGVALEKAQVHEAMRAREKEQRDLAVAQDVQKQFLPRTTPDVVGYEFFAHYQTAQRVGGDYYDFITLNDGRLAVVVADVSGKGVPAALLVAKLSSEVRTSLMRKSDLAKAVCALNQQLTDNALGEHYVTLVVMVLDRAQHALTVVNAGHPSPKLRRAATGALTDLITIEASGQPLGWDRDYPYTAATVQLEQNDTVTAFTDGVTEAMNGAGAAFGDEAVARCLTPVPLAGPDAARPRAVGAQLRNAVYKHLGNRPQSDDIAIVGFGRWEPESDHQTTVMR